MEGLTKSVLLWNAGTGCSKKGTPLDPCSSFVAKTSNATVKLSWKDPSDIVMVKGVVGVNWKSTVVVRKTGSYPESPTDGTLVVTSRIRNQYTPENPYMDTGLQNGTTYYYAVFAYSDVGTVSSPNRVKATPKQYKVMTVSFDMANSNPNNLGNYKDDALGMSSAKSKKADSAWEEFFGYKPCLFKDGRVVGYLNPNDYRKFEDGTSANITSQVVGDVMVEFPRRGLRISKSGTTVTISMTDDPNNSSFQYYAHQRGSTKKDYFYVGAYLGYYDAGARLRSFPGFYPTTGLSLSEWRPAAAALGSGYMVVGFYQFVFLQCMYMLRYCGQRDSQTVHGYGYCSASDIAQTGSTDTKGMMYGTDSGMDHVKLFGIEDFWGNLYWWLDGYYVNSSYHVLTATTGFNDTGSGYIDRGTVGVTANTTGYFSKVTATSETGLTPIEFNGSETTYFCDYCEFKADKCLYTGGRYGLNNLGPGIFRFALNFSPTSSRDYMGCRLGYL